MQLFTVGLFELELDGTVQRDADGNGISTYETEAIMSFARCRSLAAAESIQYNV